MGKGKFVDLTGLVFGELTVIKRVENEPGRYGSRWRCKCSCGEEKNIRARHLNSGEISSCGNCQYIKNKHSERAKRVFTKYTPEESLLKSAYRDRYHDGNLSFEDFCRLVKLDCFYCGKEPSNCKKKNKIAVKYNGLDRVNPNKKHDLDNVVPCCWACNIAKHNMTVLEFVEMINKLKNMLNDNDSKFSQMVKKMTK